MFADYDRYDALGLAELVEKGQVHPRELVETAISRIETTNPRLNAVVHKMYDRALEAADGRVQGTFAGVPFLLKDLGPMFEGEPTTASSRFLQFNVDSEDSVLVSRYRDAGLIVLGKTNTPEFGLVATTESDFRGPARNPWDRVAVRAGRAEDRRQRSQPAMYRWPTATTGAGPFASRPRRAVSSD
jgi:amidase